jgi:type IV secretory pathway VirB10-like protein
MNNRRLSYGLLFSLAAVIAGCGGEQAEPATPAPTSTEAAPPPPATAAEAAPPPTATAEAAPPPPPAKPAKEKIVGKWVQDFSGEVQAKADEAAKKAAGKKDPDNKKYNAALDKAKAATADNTLEFTGDTFTWNAKGKPVHVIKVEMSGTDSSLSLKLGKDEKAKKDLKGQALEITFKDDTTIEMKDPFAKKDPQTLVFKKQ